VQAGPARRARPVSAKNHLSIRYEGGAGSFARAVFLGVLMPWFSKFVIHCGTLDANFENQKGISNSMILVPLFDLKFLTTWPEPMQEFQIGGTRIIVGV
jgi:hypothetical protein